MSPHGAMGVVVTGRVIFLTGLHNGGLYAIAILSYCEFPIRVLPMGSVFSASCAPGAKSSSSGRRSKFWMTYGASRYKLSLGRLKDDMETPWGLKIVKMNH